MIDLFQFSLLFLIGIISGFIGSISGIGGVFAIPALIFLGLPPAQAIANLKFASLGLNAFVIRSFIKSKKVVWKYFIPFLKIIIIATLINVFFVINLPSNILNIIIFTLLIFSLIIIILNPKVGIKKIKTNKKKKRKGYLFLSLATFFGTFIGGMGVLKYFIVSKYFGLKYLEANASLRIPWVISSILLTIIFIYKGLITFPIAITLLIGNIIGGQIGVITEIKKGDKWVKKVLIIIIIFIIIIKLAFISKIFI